MLTPLTRVRLNSVQSLLNIQTMDRGKWKDRRFCRQTHQETGTLHITSPLRSKAFIILIGWATYYILQLHTTTGTKMQQETLVLRIFQCKLQTCQLLHTPESEHLSCNLLSLRVNPTTK
jgi:hypothetical protein